MTCACRIMYQNQLGSLYIYIHIVYIQVAARALGRHASGLVKGATTISCLGGKSALILVNGEGVRHGYD